MFRALLAHPLEELHKRHLVYHVGVISVGCYQDWSGNELAPPEDEQVMFETCRGP
jgi:hypothetical protein